MSEHGGLARAQDGGGWAGGASARFWLLFAALVPLAAIAPPTAGALVLALVVGLSWLMPTRATAVGAVLAFLVRPSLDLTTDLTVGGVNPAAAFGIAMLAVGGTVGLRRLWDGAPIWPDRLFGAATSLNVALHLLLLAVGVSAYGGLGLSTGGRELVRVLSTLAAGMLVLWWADGPGRGRLPALVALLVAGAAIPMLAGVWQWATGTGDGTDPGLNRLFGTFTHPQTYGAFLVPLVMLGLAGLVRLRGGMRTAAAAWTALAGVLLVLTYSRTFLLVLAAALGLYLLLRSGGLSARETARVAGATVVAAALGWLAFGDTIRERFLGVAISSDAVYEALAGGSQNSFQWRVLNWATLAQLGLERPLLGHGLGMTMVINPLVSPFSNKPFNAHDDFVRFFVEGGTAGLLLHALQLALFSWWLWRVSREIRGDRRIEANAIVASLLALYVASGGTTEMSLNTAVTYEVFVLLGILVALRRRSRAEAPAAA